MKKIKITLICITFSLGITGAVLAKESEKKRTLSTTAYMRNSANTGWICITLCAAGFDSQGTCTAAAMISCDGQSVAIYATQSTSNPASFVLP